LVGLHLLCWQTRHLETKLLTSKDIPGHKKEAVRAIMGLGLEYSPIVDPCISVKMESLQSWALGMKIRYPNMIYNSMSNFKLFY